MAPVRFLLCSILIAVGTASAQPFRDPSLPLDTRAADLVSRLTLAEKTSLMSSTQPAIGRLGIAARNVGSEALHGVAYQTATMFPQAQGLGHTWDPDLIQALGSAIGDEERIYNRRNLLSPGLQVWSPIGEMCVIETSDGLGRLQVVNAAVVVMVGAAHQDAQLFTGAKPLSDGAVDPGEPLAALDGRIASLDPEVVGRPFSGRLGDQVHRAADRIPVLVRRQRLVYFNPVDNTGR